MFTIHAAETMTLAVRPVARVMNIVFSIMRAWRNRHDFYRLGEMSDTELADIGLSRSDLHVVVDLPFSQDPTERLGAIAEARRREVEAMARQVH